MRGQRYHWRADEVEGARGCPAEIGLNRSLRIRRREGNKDAKFVQGKPYARKSLIFQDQAQRGKGTPIVKF